MIDLSEITVVLGQKNSGKTVLLEHLLTQMSRVVVADPKHDHFPPGFKSVSNPIDVLRAWQDGHTRLVIRDPPLKESKAEEYFRAFGQLERAYLVVDEVDHYMSEHKANDVLTDIAQYHVSHSTCGLVVAARQSTKIHTSVWGERDNLLCFHYGEYEDAKIAQVDRRTRRLINQLDPDRHQFVYKKSGRDPEVRGPVPVPTHLV